MKLIIAGSRNYSNYPIMKTVLDKPINKSNLSSIEIINDKARGADSLSERYARENNITLKVFPANWDKYGKRVVKER